MISKSKGQEKEVLSALNGLDKNKTPVRIEIENTLVRFNSVLLVRGNTVVVARPYHLENLMKGSNIRFKFPGDATKELRLEVTTPNFSLTNGTPVFLCDIPKQFLTNEHSRNGDRFNTTRYTNIHLVIPQLKWKFRILDLSHSGARVYTKSKELHLEFPLGERFDNTYIQMGKHVKVKLDYLIPRSHRYPTVGLEFIPSPDGNNHLYMTHLLENLEKMELEHLKSEPLS